MFILEKLGFKLQPHQERAIKKLDKEDKLLLYHSLGSGKTLTALSAGQRSRLPLTVIGPASLRETFPKEKRKHKIKTPVEFYSYNKPPVGQQKGIVVFDEAHRMGRLESQRSKYPDIIKGKKVLFMTGTPLRNEPAELIPLLRGLGINIPRDKKSFNETFIAIEKQYPGLIARYFRGVKPGEKLTAKNLDILRKALQGKVDYHLAKNKDFPNVIEKTIPVFMSNAQQTAYNMALKGKPSLAYKIKHGIAPSKTEAKELNAFLTATRQISNYPGQFNLKNPDDSPKIDKLVSEIQNRLLTDKNYKGVTYSNYLGHGIHPVSKRLTALNIPHALFTGKQSPKEKIEIIKDFNSGKIKQLLISGAGGEGLDLKGTKLLQIMEPHWNNPTLDQVKGRAVRYGSHSHLPKKEQVVDIQSYISKVNPKKTLLGEKQDMSTDEYLQMLAKNKQELNEQFLGVLKNLGFEKS